LVAVEVVNRINLVNQVVLVAVMVLTEQVKDLVDQVHLVKDILADMVLTNRMVLLVVEEVPVKQDRMVITDLTQDLQEVATDIPQQSLELLLHMEEVEVVQTILAVLITLMVDLVVVE
tara:strand:+ start:174 stop:527 length:354 start_codon:yes stop_codon:yes gene_type:complete